GEISEDQHKKLADQIQKLTDTKVAAIDALLKTKQEEITQV
ncbi:MAG TPA: ribosome recycling factor, partial [Oceanicaulis sp.]|nr:ribosome recycling factor [Oceanicaulis sp.]